MHIRHFKLLIFILFLNLMIAVAVHARSTTRPLQPIECTDSFTERKEKKIADASGRVAGIAVYGCGSF